MKQIVLTDPFIKELRPLVVELIHRKLCGQDRDIYVITQLAQAFDIAPKDVGFEFESWEDYYKADAKLRYPSYGQPSGGCVQTVAPPFPYYG